MLKHEYQRFLSRHQNSQHYACHSHHYWPDVTRQAMLDYWDDSAELVDEKWSKIFGEKIPQAQSQIADILKLSYPEQIVFTPNTHELVYRIFSCFDPHKPLRVLTSDSEFHSFSRQVKRQLELPNVAVTQVACEPFATFNQRLLDASEQDEYELVFISQVFFNSGVALRGLTELVESLYRPERVIVVDGYHGFMAVPTDLSRIQNKVFYLAGSYKYAQGGEGCCFASVPVGCSLRPVYTGWFADFSALEGEQTDIVGYSEDGMRFAGSTMDYSPLYRLLAVMEMYQKNGVSIDALHQYVQELQRTFLTQLDTCRHPWLNRDHLIIHSLESHGHFLTFKMPSSQACAELAEYLKQHKVLTDYRGDRLRFGFAPYHIAQEIDLSCLKSHMR